MKSNVHSVVLSLVTLLLGGVGTLPVWANSNDKPPYPCSKPCPEGQTEVAPCVCKCKTCVSDACIVSSANAFNTSVDFSISLGDKLPSQQYEAGRILLHSEYPVANLAQTIALKMNTDKISSKVVYGSDHAISQIYAAQAFVQIHQLTNSLYSIDFFYPSQISGATNQDPSIVATIPFANWTIQSVGNGPLVTNLLIQGYIDGQLSRTIQYSWDGLRNGWTMSDGDKLECVFFSDIMTDGSTTGCSNIFNGANLFTATGLGYLNVGGHVWGQPTSYGYQIPNIYLTAIETPAGPYYSRGTGGPLLPVFFAPGNGSDLHSIEAGKYVVIMTNKPATNGNAAVTSLSAGPASLAARKKMKTWSNAAGVVAREQWSLMDPSYAVDQTEKPAITIDDPNGAALVTSYIYWNYPLVTDLQSLLLYWMLGASDARNGKLQYQVNPDGSWEYYGYDATGRHVHDCSPWMNTGDAWEYASYDFAVARATAMGLPPLGPISFASGSPRVVTTSYAPVDANDLPVKDDENPRYVEDAVGPSVFSRTWHAYIRGTNGLITHITERAVTAASGYGDTNNLRDKVIFYDDKVNGVFRALPVAEEHADGTASYYSYIKGSYLQRTRIDTVVGQKSGIEGSRKTVSWLDAFRNPVQEQSYLMLNGKWVFSGSVSNTYDAFERKLSTTRSDGSVQETAWSPCCGRDADIGVDGQTIEYGYDQNKRLMTRTKMGLGNQTNLTSFYTYDGAGNRLTEALLDGMGTCILVASNSYDLAGRLVRSVDQQGIVTTYSYQQGGRITSTIRAGLTNVVEKYLDGQVKSVKQNGLLQSCYVYDFNPNGGRRTTVYSGPAGTNSPVWTRTTMDMVGRTVKEEKPGFGGAVLGTSYIYNTAGQLVQRTSTSQLPVLYSYDQFGRLFRTGTDVNGNGLLDLAGPDRITETSWWNELDGQSNLWSCQASLLYAGDGSATPVTNSIRKVQLTGLGGASVNGLLEAQSSSIDLLGNTTTSQTFVDRTARVVITVTTVPDSSNTASQVTVNGQMIATTGKTGVQTAYAYDSLGRQIAAIQAGGGRMVGSYTTCNALGQVASTMDTASNTTSYAYDSVGRRIAVTDALSNTTYTAYDALGRVLATWGATYPVAYEYDDYGRMVAMSTLRDSSLVISNYSSFITHTSSFDRTRWLYEQATGLLTNKLYADGLGPRYTYTVDGKLASRIWARGVVTQYGYDGLGQLTNISYSDSTPAVTFTYDRIGRQTGITDGTGVRAFAYNSYLQLVAETNVLAVLSRTYDNFGRPGGVALGTDYVMQYSYDPLGRFSSLRSHVSGLMADVFTYSYLPGSDLISGLTETNAGITLTHSYEANRNLITQVRNMAGTNVISQFDYVNDAVGRRTQRVDMYEAYQQAIANSFSYDLQSQLITAAMGTNAFSYAYDPIGNRRTATNTCLATGGNAEAIAYVANSLNQYSAISNQQSQTTLVPAYDLDGNMVSYNGWTFGWDAENRLISASNAMTVVQNAYDYMSRRVTKSVSSSTSAFIPHTSSFLYDGWAMVREQSAVETNSYVYGLDLSGTPQGAGTIGGILSVTRNSAPVAGCYYPTYDANGNVTEYVGQDGSVAAHYEYDPYGNTTARSGTLNQAFHYRFSTKYFDHETGWYYYGYRYYMSEIGRWVSRDPILDFAVGRLPINDEMIDSIDIDTEVDLNEYGFVSGSPETLCDNIGLGQVGPPIRCKNCLICIDRDTSGGSNGSYHIHWRCGRHTPSTCRGGGSADWPSGTGREGSGDVPNNIRKCLRNTRWQYVPKEVTVPAPYCCKKETVNDLVITTSGACVMTYVLYKTIKTCEGGIEGFAVAGPPGAVGGALLCLLTP